MAPGAKRLAGASLAHELVEFDQALGDVGRVSLADRREHVVLGPSVASSSGVALRLPRCLCFADQPWDEDDPRSVLLHVLADLERQHLGTAHLLVEELDDPPQLWWDHVRDEAQSQPAGRQVHRNRPPELVRVLILAEQRRQARGGIGCVWMPDLERGAELLDAPERARVGRVVEQLPDDLAAQASVRAALDLHERWHPILVKEQVVDCPSVWAFLGVADPAHAAQAATGGADRPGRQPAGSGNQPAAAAVPLRPRTAARPISTSSSPTLRKIAHTAEIVGPDQCWPPDWQDLLGPRRQGAASVTARASGRRCRRPRNARKAGRQPRALARMRAPERRSAARLLRTTRERPAQRPPDACSLRSRVARGNLTPGLPQIPA